MISRRMRMAGAAAALILAPLAAVAEELPIGDSSAAGFSAERLARLDARIAHEVKKGSYPGGILTILRDGQIVHQSVTGALTEGGPAMSEDAIFRIYSMTKPIVSVAAMMLNEQGRLPLAAPVAAFLPEYKDVQVWTGEKNADGTLVLAKPKRAMTIQDLLRHSSGLTYGFFGAGPVRDAYRAAGVGSAAITETNREFAKKLAGLPLEHEPGTTWEYSRSTDVLGAVIEVATGMPLGAALKAMIFDPLDMRDTGFSVPEADHGRIAEAKAGDHLAGAPLFDPRKAPRFESGGGGLVSTARDYARFAQMLLNGGVLDGARILSPTTLDFMMADHLGGLVKPGKYYLPGPGGGFGLGVGVRKERGVGYFNMPVGTNWWGGAGGTFWYQAPDQNLAVIWMMQSPSARVPMRPVLTDMVQGAIVE